ncbi:MAG: hypothetical protein WC202_05045, partial [Desulfobacterales bacterium]
LPEHKVPLPGGSRSSQNDIWVLARSKGQLISIAVEGKVSETFGPTVQECGRIPALEKLNVFHICFRCWACLRFQ